MAVKFGVLGLLEARRAHLEGEIPAALASVGPDLLAKDPDIRPVDIVAVK
jgi:hypothetical protein